jgi:Protein of unknown function (DUF3761)
VVYCRECGAKNDLGWRYCPVCGVSSIEPEPKPRLEPQPAGPVSSETSAAVTHPVLVWEIRAAYLLIALGALTTIAALFPRYYLDGKSLVSDPGNLWFNIPTIVGWALGVALLIRPATRALGAGTVIGVTLIDLAFQFPDVSSAIAGDNRAGQGFVLGNVGSGLCAVGSLLALGAVRRRTIVKEPKLAWAPWMYLCGGLFALQLLSSSIIYSRVLSRGTFASSGASTYRTTCCNAFAHRPAYGIAGAVILLVLAILVPIVASRIPHRSVGIGLFIGAGISLVSTWAYWVAHLTTTNVTPTLFGYTDAQVAQYGISLSVHPAFGYWVGTAAAVALLVATVKGVAWLSANRESAEQPTSHVGSAPGPAHGARWVIGTGVIALVLIAVGAEGAGSKIYAAADATPAAPVPPAGSGSSSGGGLGLSGGLPAIPGFSATARCRDGTLSYSAHHQGTCSHHGGVSVWLDGGSSTGTPQSAPTFPPAVVAPAPATTPSAATTVTVAAPPQASLPSSTTAAPPSASTAVVSAALPVISCATSFGVDESAPPPLPPTTIVRVPAGQVSELAVYTDIDGIMQLVGPRGWRCDATYGADGGGGVQAYPAGALTSSGNLSPNAQAIVGNQTSACVGCMEEQACPLFPVAAADYLRDYQTDCPRARPGAESFFRISDGVVGFEDPPGVKGSAWPSGGIYPANGVMTYYSGSSSGSWAETCTLPESEHALCTTTLNAFVSAYGTQ